jgi:Pectate lyase superfamily protein
MTPEGSRRLMLGLGAGTTALAALAPRDPAAQTRTPERTMLSAANFGCKGDGVADDTAPLQAALDAAFAANGSDFLLIPPGTYRITRTLRIGAAQGETRDITRHHGILAHGARLRSTIQDGSNVLQLLCRSTMRFLTIEGLDIQGEGREGNGIHLECEYGDHYLYNFCLRDIVVQGVGGDGLRLIGNVFEGQLINVYSRDNKKNGVTFGHGAKAGILSAIHVFGSVFGQNGRFGAAMIHGCYDVSFHGCYFLLNGKEGLVAENGCTLLSNCGFENNHESAPDFAHGGAGIWLQNFGTLIGCTGYSMFKQTRLIQAYVVSQLAMIGCSGSGDAQAKDAGLARLGGEKKARAVVMSSQGTVEYMNGFEALEINSSDKGGVRLASNWQSPNLLQLGNYRLWVDKSGKLRLKNGLPGSDEDGTGV